MKLGYLMTVFAVSGSMVLLFHQANKHLFNSFMKKFEYEIRGSTKAQSKKKVRFAKDVVEVPMEKESDGVNVEREYEVIDKILLTDDAKKWKHEKKLKHVMPLNRIALYRGIMNDRKGRLDF
ncbi:hypothetical protein VNO78_21179 [Psophocarpus tetragonolobus]|uniref:Uncharacterized protein n=1 Tax=Psophocarpus tetragonolobus TaxID=3891 RepID=A0AAN9SER5_PSOTE